MSSRAADLSTYRYCVFHLTIDELRSAQVPVGVALWSEGAGWFRFRFLGDSERVSAVSGELRPFIRAAAAQLQSWVDAMALPYADRSGLRPWHDDWWALVRDLFAFRVHLGEARPIDCAVPENEFDTLYTSVVRPGAPSPQHRRRIDHEIGRSLKEDVLRRFDRNVRIPAFGHAEVEVLYARRSAHRQVILEGVNLASEEGERDADALASRAERILAANGVTTSFLVGLVTPSEGLDGMSHLREWLQERTKGQVYDLSDSSERSKFSAAAERELRLLEADTALPLSER